jgi:hypothetical protein
MRTLMSPAAFGLKVISSALAGAVPTANRAAVRAETAQAVRQERDILDTPSLFEFFETGCFSQE